MAGVYHPILGIIYGQSVYDVAHEWAHVAQHAEGSLIWRIGRSLRTVPVLGRVAMLAIETEAAAMALWTLMRCKALRPCDLREAARGLLQAYATMIDIDNSEAQPIQKPKQSPLPMPENAQILQEAHSIRTLLKWFGGGMIAAISAGVVVAVGDHYTLKEVSSKLDRLEMVYTSRVDQMWYGGGWDTASIRTNARGGAGRQSQPANQP